MRRHRKDGTAVDLAVSIAPLRDAAGRIRGVVAVAGDVTERKREHAERTLLCAESERRQKEAEVLAELARGIGAARDLDALLRRLHARSADQRGLPADDPGRGHRRLDGGPIRIDEVIEGLLFVDNRTPRSFTDRDEVLLAWLADHAAVAIRNVRLLSREQAARADAEAASRAKDEFLAMLGRELPNPLGAIANAIMVLDRISKQDERASRLRAASRATRGRLPRRDPAQHRPDPAPAAADGPPGRRRARPGVAPRLLT